MNRRIVVLLASSAMAICTAASAYAQGGESATAVSAGHPNIKSVAAITEVFGDGQKLIAAAVEYDREIRNASVAMTAFSVEGRTITRAYANTQMDKAARGENGRFVILELSPTDPGAATFAQNMPGQGGRGPGMQGRGPGGPGGAGGSGGPGGQSSEGGPGGSGTGQGGPPNSSGGTNMQGPRTGGPPRNMSNGAKRTPAKVSVTQTGELIAANGKKVSPDPNAIVSAKVINLVVDDFTQHTFTDPKSNESVPYNLFVPKGYDKSKSYPLIIFIHDAGVLSTQVDTTLLQGLGAVIWATPTEQAKHPAFVLAPQFNRTPAGGGSLTDVTVDLVQSVASEYNVDKKRIYTTGQSLGCTLSMEMLLKYPDLFAAAMLVAGQIEDTSRTVGLAHQKFWMTVSEGDFIAYPTMNKSLPLIEAAGAKVARGRWSARLAGPELATKDKEMLSQGTNILYTTFEKGTTFPLGLENSTGTEHMGTWKFAYLNEGIRDWVFSQSR